MNEDFKVGEALNVKDINQTSIFKLILKNGPISRKGLTAISDFSSATITNHVNILLEKGYVIETKKGYSTGGRKPVYLTVNPDKSYILVISFKINTVELGLFNLRLELINKIKVKINSSPEEIIAKVLDNIETIVSREQLSLDKIIGIGVSIPGIVDEEKKSLVFAPNLGWRNIDISALIQEKYDIQIIVENEANAAAVGEKVFSEISASSLVYVSINEGVGCGIIIDDNLYQGITGNAGEFGHIVLESDGRDCHCGQKGCWETIASEKFIVETVKERLKTSLKIEEIYSQALEGRDELIEILQETGRNIGRGLLNILYSLNPEYVIIGGNIVKARKYISQTIEGVLAADSLPSFSEQTKLRFSELGESAASYGMAQIIFDQHFHLK
ncbi:MAG: ROK family protein [Halanaerobiaceae bacterium]